jgi:glycerol-3-phosphate dehydrogenase
MKRSIPNSDQNPLDLLIVGGGIHGAAMAYYAGLNKLKVALIEKDDFCAHTSANSQKVIHGGLRYLQSFDIKRVLESIRERQRFYALFPHLVRPLPCVLPLSGWGTKSREAMGIAFLLYRFLQKIVYRNGFTAHLDKQPHLLSVSKMKEMFPSLILNKSRGGAYWYDGLCLEPERAVISLLKSTASKGASVANYAKLTKISRIDDSTLSVFVQDRLSGKEHIFKTKKIALCTGPWLKDDFSLQQIPEELETLHLISGVNIITKKLTESPTSIALRPQKSSKSGLMFVLPWKKFSISGTIWNDAGTKPQFTQDTSEAVQQLNSQVHDCYPISSKEPLILHRHFGYVPGNDDSSKSPSERILSHYLLVDREKEKSGDVLQVVGVKFTTAFDVAYKSLVKLFPNLLLNNSISPDNLPIGSPSSTTEECVEALSKQYDGKISAENISNLYAIVGVELTRIIEEYILPAGSDTDTSVSDDDLLKAMTGFFIHEEMVVSLVDLVRRRFFPGLAEPLSEQSLNIIAGEMALILDWTPAQLKEEIEKLNRT